MPKAVPPKDKTTVIQVARSRWLLLSTAALAAAAGMLYWELLGRSWVGQAHSVLATIAAACGLVTCIWWLVSNRRLVVAETGVLLLAGRSNRLLGLLPFEEIESVHFHHGDEGGWLYSPGVAIQVRKKRRRTFWPWLLPSEDLVVLPDRFVRSPEVLRKFLRRRWQDYRDRLEMAGKPPPSFPEDYAQR
jgi:hypothetical protein